MKKRILSILLICCMALTLFPTAAFAAQAEAAALPSGTAGLCENHPEHGEGCGYAPQTEYTAGAPCGHACEICKPEDGGTDPAAPAGATGAALPMTLLGAARPAATQYTYTLHYDANGGSGAPPSQSVTSSEFNVWVPISEIIPTRDGYTFMGWANSRTGKPIYGGNGGYTECLVVHGYDMSTTIYAIWEVHNHSWGEWTSNGNGTHTRTCTTDSSHTETGNCSGGKATGTEKAICETCNTAYGELLPLIKTDITTPPTLPAEGYVGDQYLDGNLKGGEAKVEGTDEVVPGTFRFKHNWGGVIGLGENCMEILFTPDDAETYATAECIVIVTGLKHTITSVTEEVLPDEPLGTAFEYLGLPFDVNVITNTGATFCVPVTWDSSSYNPNARGEQIITGELNVEESLYANELEPTSTVKAIAKITLIDDEAIVPTLEPPTYSRQIYSGDFCQLAFSDEYLSGGTATADGETVPGVFTLNEKQEKYGYWGRDGGLVQVGLLALKVTFTPYDRLKFSTAECTVNVDVIPRKFRQANTSYIDNKKIGTAFEDLGLPNAFYFFAAADEPNHEGSGLNGNVPGIIKWDDSNYDPNSYEEQTIYGEVNRAEFEKYYIVPEGADLRGVVKVTLQADPVDTEITQLPVFRWKNGDFTLPDNTMFVNRIFEMGATGGATANLADGVAKLKGTDTVVPGTFSFKEGTPEWFDELGENTVTVVFTPTDQYGYRKAETTIKVNVIKNTFKRCEEPDPITEKKLGTTFAGLNLPETVVVEAIDGLRVGMEVSWDESSYDAQSTAWQTIPGTLVFDANDEHKYQQPEPAVTAAIRVKLLGSEDAPAITTTTLPGGTVGTPYHHQLQATGGGFILWELFSGELPKGLTLKQTTGEISGTPTAEGTAQFTVRALNSVGNDKKELSITITNAPAAEHTVTVTTAGGGTASASSTSATAGTEITLTATPNADYRFKEWQVVSGNVTIANDKFAMPDGNVEIKAIFEQDAILTPVEHGVIVTTDGNGKASASHTMASNGTEITLTAAPNAGYHFKEWQVIRGGVTIANNKFTMPDTNVEIKAIFEQDAPPAPVEHTVTVNTDGNGTASASHTMASNGTAITLTAQPNAGYHFKEWQVVSGGVTIANDKFTMPDTNVEIKAIFEKDAPSAEDLVDPVIRIIPSRHGGYPTQGGTRTAADFFKPGEAPKGAKITAITPPASPSILASISVDNGILRYDKEEKLGEQLETDVYTVTITSDDYEPISAPLTVRQYLFAGFRAGWDLSPWVYGDTRTYKWKAINPGENGAWSAIMQEQGIFEIYEETVDTTSEPGVSHYTTKVRAIKAGETFINILYVSDTTASWSPWSSSTVVAGGKVVVRGLTVTAGSATITKGDALPKDLVRCTGLLDSEGRTDDRDTVLDNALSYRLLNANNEEVAADTARNTPGTYTVVPTATLKSGWDERYSLNSVNGTLTVEDKVDEQFHITVKTDGNGTASASHAKAVAGTEITLAAAPNAGYHFKEWQVVSGGVTIANNKFAMPDGSVMIKAIFEQDAPPAPVEYAIIVTTDGNGTASANTSTASTGTEITLTAAPNAGYHFKEWQVISGGVTIANNKFAMPDGSVMIKAIFEQDAPPAPVEYAVIVTTDGNGTASASPTTASTGTEITLTATPNAGYHFKEWQVVSGGVTIANNKFAMPDGSVMIKAIFEQDAPPAPVEYIVTFDGNGGTPSVGSMTTTGQKLAALPGASRSGSYRFDGWYTQKSGGEKITTDTAFSANTAVYAHWTYTGGDDPSVAYYTLRFETGGGSDIVSVRAKRDTYIDLTGYAPTWRGHTFIGWYSDRSLTNRVSGVYLTKHTTVYAGWRADESTGTGANPFTDVSEMDWFYGDVMFVYENGLMPGTGDTLFSPHDTATRGMMAAILWRMEGSPEPEGKNSFIDVETGAQYADAITWTAENGIFDGYVEEGFDGHSEDRFEPDEPITREQLAAIFYRYAGYKDYDLTADEDLDKFKDADEIADTARAAMQWAVASGLMDEKPGDMLDPQAAATRAEIAAMLRRFIEKYELAQGIAPGGLMGWIAPELLEADMGGVG